MNKKETLQVCEHDFCTQPKDIIIGINFITNIHTF